MDGKGRMGGEEVEIEFSLPEGIALDGESGEAIIAWSKTPDGRIRVTAIDGNPVSSEPEEGQEGEEMTRMPEDAIDDIGNT